MITAEELARLQDLIEIGHRHAAMPFAKLIVTATENESLMWYAQRLARILGVTPVAAMAAMREAAEQMLPAPGEGE